MKKRFKINVMIKKVGLACIASLMCFLSTSNSAMAEGSSVSQFSDLIITNSTYCLNSNYIVTVNSSASDKNVVNSSEITNDSIWSGQLAGYRVNNPGTGNSGYIHSSLLGYELQFLGPTLLNTIKNWGGYAPAGSTYPVLNSGLSSSAILNIIKEHNERAEHMVHGYALDSNTGNTYAITQIGEHAEYGYAVSFVNAKWLCEGAINNYEDAEKAIKEKLIKGNITFDYFDPEDFIYFVTSDNPDRVSEIVNVGGTYTKIYGSTARWYPTRDTMSGSFIKGYASGDPVTTSYEIHDNLHIITNNGSQGTNAYKVVTIDDTYAGRQLYTVDNSGAVYPGGNANTTKFNAEYLCDDNQQVFWIGSYEMTTADLRYNDFSSSHIQYSYAGSNGVSVQLTGKYKKPYNGSVSSNNETINLNKSEVDALAKRITENNSNISTSVATEKAKVFLASSANEGICFTYDLDDEYFLSDLVKESPLVKRDAITTRFHKELQSVGNEGILSNITETEFAEILKYWSNSTGKDWYNTYYKERNRPNIDDYYVMVVFPLMGYSVNSTDGNGNVIDFQRDIYLGTHEGCIAYALGDHKVAADGSISVQAKITKGDKSLGESLDAISGESLTPTIYVSKLYNLIKGADASDRKFKNLLGEDISTEDIEIYNGANKQQMMYNIVMPSICSILDLGSYTLTGMDNSGTPTGSRKVQFNIPSTISIITKPIAEVTDEMLYEKSIRGGKMKTLSELLSTRNGVCYDARKTKCFDTNNSPITIGESFQKWYQQAPITNYKYLTNYNSVNLTNLLDDNVNGIHNIAVGNSSNATVRGQSTILLNRNSSDNAQALLQQGDTAPDFRNILFAEHFHMNGNSCPSGNSSTADNSARALLLDLQTSYHTQYIADLFWCMYSTPGKLWDYYSRNAGGTIAFSSAISCGKDLLQPFEKVTLQWRSSIATQQDLLDKDIAAQGDSLKDGTGKVVYWPKHTINGDRPYDYHCTIAAFPNVIPENTVVAIDEINKKARAKAATSGESVNTQFPYIVVMTAKFSDASNLSYGGKKVQVDVNGTCVPLFSNAAELDTGVYTRVSNPGNMSQYKLYSIMDPTGTNGTLKDNGGTTIKITSSAVDYNDGLTSGPIVQCKPGYYNGTTDYDPNGSPNDNTYAIAFRVNRENVKDLLSRNCGYSFDVGIRYPDKYNANSITLAVSYEVYAVADVDFDGSFTEHLNDDTSLLVLSKYESDKGLYPDNYSVALELERPETWLKFTNDEDMGAYGIMLANTPIQTGSPNVNKGNTDNSKKWFTPATWNTLTGIPSTENVCVITGGQSYTFAIGGWEITEGARTSSKLLLGEENAGTLNTGVGRNITSRKFPVERKIVLRVNMTNSWGSNEACTLSCAGHTSESHTCAGCDFNYNVSACGASVTCPHCGASYGPACNSNDKYCAGGHAKGETCNGDCASRCDKVHTVSGTCTHSFTVTYYCDGRKATVSGCGNAAVTEDKHDTLTHNQRYCQTATATCKKGGGSVTSPTVHSDLIDLGYTVAGSYGCAHSGKQNFVDGHRQTVTHDYTIIERVDYLQSRNLDEWTISPLGYVVANWGTQNSQGISMNNMFEWNHSAMCGAATESETRVWRTVSQFDANDHAGRIQFTQFSYMNDSHISQQAFGVTLRADGSLPGDYGQSATRKERYFLGNCVIVLTAEADSECILINNPEYNHSAATALSKWESGYSESIYRKNITCRDDSFGLSNRRGIDMQSHADYPTPMTKKTSKYLEGGDGSVISNYNSSAPGDAMTADELRVQSLAIVNNWMEAQPEQCKVYTLSDIVDFTQIAATGINQDTGFYTSQKYTQTIQADIWIHPMSVSLFSSDFTNNQRTIYRTHVHDGYSESDMNTRTVKAGEYINESDLTYKASDEARASFTEKTDFIKNIYPGYNSLNITNIYFGTGVLSTGLNGKLYWQSRVDKSGHIKNQYKNNVDNLPISILTDTEDHDVFGCARGSSLLSRLQDNANMCIGSLYQTNGSVLGESGINENTHAYSIYSKKATTNTTLYGTGGTSSPAVGTFDTKVDITNHSYLSRGGSINDVPSFSGYYADYYYPSFCVGRDGCDLKVTGSGAAYGFQADCGKGSAVNGLSNIELYGTALVIPDIKIKDGTPNGLYKNPGLFYNTYSQSSMSYELTKGIRNPSSNSLLLSGYVAALVGQYGSYNSGAAGVQRLCSLFDGYKSDVSGELEGSVGYYNIEPYISLRIPFIQKAATMINTAVSIDFGLSEFKNYYNMINNLRGGEAIYENLQYWNSRIPSSNITRRFGVGKVLSSTGEITAESNGLKRIKKINEVYENYTLPGLNDICIFTPVSNEGCLVLSNEISSILGKYTYSWYEDNSNADMRVLGEVGVNGAAYEDPSNLSSNLNDFAVVGNTVYIWYSDIGDFNSSDAQSLNLFRKTGGLNTGRVQAYSKSSDNMPIYNVLTNKPTTSPINYGYTGVMNTSRWVEKRYVKFPCAVSYVSLEPKSENGTVSYVTRNKVIPAGQWIDLTEVCITSLGNQLTNSNELPCYKQSVLRTDPRDENSGCTSILTMSGASNTTALWYPDISKFTYTNEAGKTQVSKKTYETLQQMKYGSLYSFKILTSAEETTNATVEFSSIAINAPSYPDETFANDGARDDTDDIMCKLTGSSILSEKYTHQGISFVRKASLGDVNSITENSERYKQEKAQTDFYVNYGVMNDRFGVTIDAKGSDIFDVNAELTITSKHYPAMPGQDLVTSGGKTSINLGFHTNGSRRLYHPDVVLYKDSFQIVGRIGNLSLHDTGDFRYSNLFKKVYENDWLISNVIENVNPEYSVRIGTAVLDILGNPTDTYGYAVSPITAQIMSSGSSPTIGPKLVQKDASGNYNTFTLPLTPAKNNVPEFINEPVRLGYSTYFDIETFGNYIDDRTTSSVEVTPHYVLYNYKDGTFIRDIEIWYGSENLKYLAYNSDEKNGKYITTDVTEITTDGTPLNSDMGVNLYISKDDLKRYATNTGTHNFALSDPSKYNIEVAISNLTNKLVANCTSKNYGIYEHIHSVQGDVPIGNTSALRLTQNASAAIGTRTLYTTPYYSNGWKFKMNTNSIVMNNYYLQNDLHPNVNDAGSASLSSDFTEGGSYATNQQTYDGDFAKQNQRWYFSLKLPSSAYVTSGAWSEERDASGILKKNTPNQYDIQKNHEDLKRANPYSVIICYLEIRSSNNTWTLEYDASIANGGTPLSYDIFNLTKEGSGFKYNIPEGLDTSNNSPNNRITVAKLTNGSPNPDDWKKWQPAVIFTAWENSSMDRITSGTH